MKAATYLWLDECIQQSNKTVSSKVAPMEGSLTTFSTVMPLVSLAYNQFMYVVETRTLFKAWQHNYIIVNIRGL